MATPIKVDITSIDGTVSSRTNISPEKLLQEISDLLNQENDRDRKTLELKVTFLSKNA
ncbi:hypothetical protein [Nostoc sp. C057]|jgi:hypothetical protein|uniref:hypothetical protein n=1 Tax=Nostoc sp. C057 TaxID=2576903 RepID=UPI0015C3D7E1|nr:hypothetical protein [Nostoc sp. C057]